VITPIDRRGALDASRREAFARNDEIARLHLERMMAVAERVCDERPPRGVIKRCARHLEESKVLAPAIEQNLVAETVDDLEAEDGGIETLRAREVSDLDTEMIQPLEFHRGHRIRLSTSVND
jgi:hypothetical protein